MVSIEMNVVMNSNEMGGNKFLFVLMLVVGILILLSFFLDRLTIAVFAGFVVTVLSGIAFGRIEFIGIALLGVIAYLVYFVVKRHQPSQRIMY